MKNIKDKAATKQARKALKKQLKDKLVYQIEILVSEFGPDIKKAKKAIDKASKNLAKTLASKLSPVVHAAVVTEAPKVKKAKKAEAVVVAEKAPVVATPAKSTSNKKAKDTEPEKAE
ncbi:hypothetical protein AAFN85_21260 [Mucilaginibacter sp. CAU 1740]|uniref:hypothetical protein n=1 Tax=Mucilaginibacter sp. CAU 1740 TaxID=3140365 RepID=UPI00325A4B60